MTTRDFTANVISASKVVPDGNFKDSKASGVWDINEALDLIKGGNWPNVANLPPSAFVDGLFQTHLYTGTGSSQTITNNIDLSGEGGLVWIKGRNATSDHALVDTERGGSNSLASNNGDAQRTDGAYGLTFNSNGFTSTGGNLNVNGREQVSWTFRKQPKFFDIVTYTGNATARTISHNLGSAPGMILIKRTDSNDDWYIYHRGNTSDPETEYLRFTDNATADSANVWNDTEPTATEFTIKNNSLNNANGGSFVAYLFAHNDDDGGFGEPGDQDIIKCGNYTGNGSDDGPEITLGFEPQFFMFKKTSGSGNWFVYDTTRGWGTGDSTLSGTDSSGPYLLWNDAGSAQTSNRLFPTSTGVKIHDSNDSWNENGANFIYMAIRAGGMQTPTTASDVFSIDTANDSNDPKYDSTHIVDMALIKLIDDTGDWFNYARPMRYKYLSTNDTGAEANASEAHFDHMRGFSSSNWGNTDYQAWMWKRARGYFDVVTYTGTGSNRTVSHNLGVTPEMMWIKCRSNTDNWVVFHKDVGATKILQLNNNIAETTTSTRFNDTAPTSSVFTVSTDNEVNGSGRTYIAYLFATAPGVSKVGSFTSDGSDMTIDCGFTSGASFVLLKRTDDSDDWFIFRDIVAGNDKRLKLNTTGAEATGADNIDPDNSGFIINNNILGGSGRDFIFYAIAAIS